MQNQHAPTCSTSGKARYAVASANQVNNLPVVFIPYRKPNMVQNKACTNLNKAVKMFWVLKGK